MADSNNTVLANEAEIEEETQETAKSPVKSRGQMWKDEEVFDLINIMNEETILINLDKAKTPKEKRACYRAVYTQLQKKGIN